jgi:hypothetical protein
MKATMNLDLSKEQNRQSCRLQDLIMELMEHILLPFAVIRKEQHFLK